MSFKRGAAGAITRTKLDNYSFASKLEAALYAQIKLQALAGEVVLEQVQDHVYLTDARVLYIPDFRVHIVATGETEWWEAKGFESERWPTVKKLWAYYGPGRLRIFKGTHRSLRMTETITPKTLKILGLLALALLTTGCQNAQALKLTPMNWPTVVLTPTPTAERAPAWADRERECPAPEPVAACEPCVCETKDETTKESE